MSAPVLQISYSLANIENAVHQFWQYAHQYHILAFSGDLGAGKTTFIHALCDYLGVEDAVSSPTFALINEYSFYKDATTHIINHMDWYRLRDENEAINAGMEDALMQKNNYSLIEWPEKAAAILPFPHLHIEIKSDGADARTMEIWLKEK
jgi:tRNA threonylcarbamoyladenosine biosynthesis protein TsaE